MSMYLKHFSPAEILISRAEAVTILKFFWPDLSLTEGDLSNEDVGFAQALLLEAIDASYKMGYVHVIFDTFYGKIPGSFVDVRKMIKSFAKKAAKHWFKHLRDKSVEDADIYAAVRATIANNFRSTISTRMATGDLIY